MSTQRAANFLAIALLTLPLWAMADAAPQAPAAEKKKPVQQKTAAAYELEKMVVTPSRSSEQPILTVPQSVAVIDDEALGSTVVTTASEAVQTIPGVNLAPSGGAGDTSNRNSDYWNSGFTIRGLGAQRALVLSDGVRQSGQGIGYGGGNLALYDLNAIERIEVLKGPGSVLYGTDAFGGVIQLFTHQPEVRESFGTNGRLRASYDGSRNITTEGGFVDVGDEKWGLVLGGSYAKAGDPSLPFGRIPQDGSYTKQSGNMTLVYRPTDNSQLKILANVVDARDINIFDEGFAPGPTFIPFFFKIPFYQRSMYGAEYSQEDVSEHVESWKVGVYQQMLKRQFNHATPRQTGGSFVSDNVITQDTVRTTELQPQVVFDFAPHTITVGSDIGFDTTYLPENSSLTGYALRGDASQQRQSLYAQDRWELDDKNILNLGARYDRFELDDHLAANSDRTADGVSGSLGYTYMLDPKTSIYTTIATGLRSPDLDERYKDTVIQFFTQQVTVQGNPDLTPERSYSFELGTKKESDAGDFELAGYYNRIDDFIAPVQISSTSLGGGRTAVVQQRRNIGTVDIYGFEAGWTSSRAGNWRNYVNVSQSWSDQSHNVALANYQVNYGFGYQFKGVAPFKSVTPQWMGRYVGPSRDTINDVYFSPFHVADAQVAFDWSGSDAQRTQLIIGVKNVFNKLYEQPFFDQPQPGRGLFAALQVDF